MSRKYRFLVAKEKNECKSKFKIFFNEKLYNKNNIKLILTSRPKMRYSDEQNVALRDINIAIMISRP